MSATVINADCLEALRCERANSVDALVTDPPAGIGFMGKDWDGDKGGRAEWVAWLTGVMRECMRVMKSGAHGLVWALPRTSHWTATALEDAGFEVRDVITHHFGTGFPKSKALLKPASEHWILVRKPGPLRHLSIDACRVPGRPEAPGTTPPTPTNKNCYGDRVRAPYVVPEGRWPANLILSHAPECDAACVLWCPVRGMDEQSGVLKSPKTYERSSATRSSPLPMNRVTKGVDTNPAIQSGYGDSGGASRFFYCPKPSTAERNAGLPRGERNTHPTVKSIALMTYLIRLITPPGGLVLDPFAGSGTTGVAAVRGGWRFVGIEREAEYAQLARARILAAQAEGEKVSA